MSRLPSGIVITVLRQISVISSEKRRGDLSQTLRSRLQMDFLLPLSQKGTLVVSPGPLDYSGTLGTYAVSNVVTTQGQRMQAQRNVKRTHSYSKLPFQG